MKISVIAIGATKTGFVKEGISQYLARLRHYSPVELVELPDLRNARSLTQAQQKDGEGRMLLDAVTPADRVILLDERGVQPSSREFSAMLQRDMTCGSRRIVYLIGGPYGFSDQVYGRADARLSLSRMTFSHEMVRLFFVEQIYRAFTIMRNEPYHHD